MCEFFFVSATELQLRKGLEKSKNGLISEPKDSSCVRSCSVSDLPEFCAKCRCSLNTCDNIILAEPPETKNINFTEHVRILEENRILKIQVSFRFINDVASSINFIFGFQLANANATLNSSFKLGSARQQRRPGSSAPPALLK